VVSQQVGQANVNGTKLQALTIPLPPLAEQEQIVAELERRQSVVAETEAQVEADLKRGERLRQSILKQAFAGKLVPQDSEDEPAGVLLERICSQRRAGPDTGRREKAEQLRLV
jgi:type I restriction enzyme S subunit